MIFQFAHCQMRDTIVESALLKEINITGYPDSVIHYTWDENNKEWNKGKKNIYQYDTYGNKINEVVFNWSNNEWEQENKTDYIFYDSLFIEQVNYWWDWSYFEWIQYQRYNLNYDSNNNLIQNLYTKWSESILDWINDSLYIYEYNTSNLQSVYYEYKWSNFFNEWEKFSKTVYTYDTSGNNTIQTQYLWEFDLLIWESYRKNIYVYNTNNEMIEKKQLFINNSYNWENDWKRNYSYYENSFIKDVIYFVWISGNDSWFEDYKFSCNYDDNYKLIKKTGYIYDWDQLLWENHFQTLHVYNDNNLLSTTIYYYWNYGQWKELEKYKYYYPEHNSIKIEYEANNLQIYPIPANKILIVSLSHELPCNAQIQIYDVSGRKVYINQNYFYGSKIEINLPELTDGSYVLKIIVENKIITRKIIIRN